MTQEDLQSDTFSHYSFTDTGKKRKDNQDNFCLVDKGSWFVAVVCDGMGGVRGGNIASEIATNVVFDEVHTSFVAPDNAALEKIVQKANAYIYAFSELHPEYKGLGTTISILVCDKDGYRIAHVGDSRIYRLRDGDIELITTDHTWAKELELSGMYEYTAASHSPMSHMLTRSLGVKPEVHVDVMKFNDLHKHDVFMLCSDGIHNYCDDSFISRSFDQALTNLKAFAHILADYSLEKGGEDNLTVLACSVNSKKEELPFSKPKATFQVGRELSISIDDVVSHVENVPSKPIDVQSERTTTQPSYSYFFYGSLFALLIGLYVKSIRPMQEYYVENTVAIDSTLAAVTGTKSQEIIPQYTYKKDLFLKEKFSINLESLYRQIKDKKQEILFPLLEVAANELPQNSPGIRTDINPSRPIVWENEATRAEQIKRVYADDLHYSDFKNEVKASNDARIIDLKEKPELREKIFDIQEKITQINLLSQEEKEKYISRLKSTIEDVKSDLDLLESVRAELKNNEIVYSHLKKLLAQNNETSLIFLANRLISFDPTLEPLTARLKLLSNTRDYYSNLMRKVSSSEELILKLSNSQREYAQALSELRSETSRVLLDMMRELAAFYGGIDYLNYLLILEKSRVQRYLGYIQVITQTDTAKRNSMIEIYLKELSALTTKYKSIETVFPVTEESRVDLNQRFERIKNQLEG